MASVNFYPNQSHRLQDAMRLVGWIVLSLLMVPVAVVFPILVIVSVVLLVGFSFRSNAVTTGTAIVVVLGILGWMNSTKAPSGDWGWYTQHFLLLQRLDFTQYLGQRIGPFTIKTTEPTYYFIASVIARLSNGSIPALAWAISSLIYIPLGVSVGLISARMVKVPMHVGIATLVALMVGVTFTLTTQLVRQEVGGALLVFGFVLFYFRHRTIGMLLATLGVLSHNSSLVPLVAIIAAYWFAIRRERVSWVRVTLLWGAFIAVGYAYLLGPGADYYQNEDPVGEISIAVILMDIAILLAFLFARSHLDEPKRFLNILAAAAIIYSGFLLGVSLAPLPFLRMYFYVELFRTLMVGAIVCAVLRLRYGTLLAVPILLTAVVYIEMRIRASPFWYGGGLVAHILRPFAFFN